LIVGDCISMVLLLNLETLLMLAGEALGVIRNRFGYFQISILEKLRLVGCYGGCLDDIGGR